MHKSTERKSLANFMSSNNSSAISALLHKYPELGDYEYHKPVPEDELILKHLTSASTPPLRALQHIEKATGCHRTVIQRLLAGDGTEKAELIILKRNASSGGKEVVGKRVQALSEFIEINFTPLTPIGYPQHTANTLNNRLYLPESEPMDRVAKFMTDKNLDSIGVAWCLFDIATPKYSPESGARVFIRKMMNAEFGEKHKTLVSFSESEEVKVVSGDSYDFEINIPYSMTPIDVFNSNVVSLIEKILDEKYSSNGYKNYRDYLRHCSEKELAEKELKKARKAFRKELRTNGQYSATLLENSPKEVSDSLSVLNRYIKNRKLVCYKLGQSIYDVKSDLLISAVNKGDAKIVKLIKRENPYMLDETDMIRFNEIIGIIEAVAEYKIRVPLKSHQSITELYCHLEQSGIASLTSEAKVVVSSDELTYQAAIVRYLLSLSPESMAKGLHTLFANSYAVYDCFNKDALKAKRWHKNESRRFSKFFNDKYANVWEIEFEGNIFHIPQLNCLNWEELGVEEAQIPYRTIGSSYVSPEIAEKYPLEYCLKVVGCELNIY